MPEKHISMKHLSILILSVLIISNLGCKDHKNDKSSSDSHVTDSLPNVLAENHSDLIYGRLRYEAAQKFAQNVLPDKPEELIKYKEDLRKMIIGKSGIIIDHDLPLNIGEKGSVRMKGYTIKNIIFQTRPGVYATANLFIPDGKGPFPGIINMLGHWRKGKIDSTGPQAVGHTLALNGYVCLTVDPWGSGERTTVHGDFEYHGSNLGASLMNIGESLLGVQVSDNMRGIDLLCSLSYVDPKKIGATGASGGGNQTLWLGAVDERVKASVPVVSVGTFESYIMRSNCICELLIDGLTFMEESGALVLANAVMPINHTKDSNPTFFPDEMLRSYSNARKAFVSAGLENNISYRLFDLTHGYMKEDREAMLGWFDLYLKNTGNGAPRAESPFIQLPEEKLLVYPKGDRDSEVLTTEEYCIKKGKELKANLLKSGKFNVARKKEELREILRIKDFPVISKTDRLSEKSGWERYILETSDNELIPLLLKAPSAKEKAYTILCSSDGKSTIPMSLIDDYKKRGEGIVIVDLAGVGELTSTESLPYDYNGKLHTLSRAELWLGRTVLGDWVRELDLVTKFLLTEMKASKVNIDGTKEAGLAGLFLAALDGKTDAIILRESPVSYLFDNRKNVDFYSMGIHLPGFLVWGDVSLAAALSGENILFIDPRTMSGESLDGDKLRSYKDEYARIRQLAVTNGRTDFN